MAASACPVFGFNLFSPPKAGPKGDRRERGGQDARMMEVRIGAVLPLTGVVASDGEAAMQGLKIAEADLNKRGDLPFRVRILAKDGKFEPRESLNAFNLLYSQDVAGMILIGDNTCQMTKVQVAKRAIPTIASMTVTERSVKGNPWMFRCWPPIATSARIMARHMSRARHVRNAAIFHIDAMYGLESRKGFTAAFEAEGGKVTGVESFPFLASDLRAPIAKLLATRPEGLFVTGFGQGLITAINQLREAGYAGTIFTDTAVVDPRVKKNLTDLKNIVFIGNAFDETRAAGGLAADFAAKYRALTGAKENAMPPQAPFAYTAACLLAHALCEARGAKDRVIATLAGLKDFKSVLGPVSYDAQREIVLPLFVKTFGPAGENVLIDDKLWRE